MEKRLFYTFIATFLFLIVYAYLTPKPTPQPQPTSVVPVSSAKEEKKLDPLLLDQETELSQAPMGNFIVTYSPRGGYIKKISVLPYGDDMFFSDIGFRAEDKDTDFLTEIKSNQIIFSSAIAGSKVFTFDNYCVKLTFSQPQSKPMIIFHNQLHKKGLEQNYQEVFFLRHSTMLRRNIKKITDKEEVLDNIQFAGARDQYFCISLLKGLYSVKWEKYGENGALLLLMSPPPEISLYIGPQIHKELKQFGIESIIRYGGFDSISVWLAKILSFLYSWTKNWGLSIILLTVVVYFILFPFTMQSTKAMKKMAEIQPELSELKKKLGDNPQKFQKEQLELFKKYRINPLGGCLPLLFQLPIFFALFQVFSRFAELKGVRFMWINDLTLPDRLVKLPFSIPYFGGYINLLPILMIIVNLAQQKITSSSVSSSEQKFTSLFMLGFMGILFYHFPSCLILYWFVQNLLTLAYQMQFGRVKSTVKVVAPS